MKIYVCESSYHSRRLNLHSHNLIIKVVQPWLNEIVSIITKEKQREEGRGRAAGGGRRVERRGEGEDIHVQQRVRGETWR